MTREYESMADRLILLLATGLGLGYAPRAPGTVGSLWGPLMMWGWQQAGWSPWWVIAPIVGLQAVGIPLCGRAAELLGVKDPGAVVFDEIAAFAVVFAIVPVTLISAVTGFLWFRLFDILKPWPVSRMDRLSGGVGIMADDVAAGVYAAAALWCTMWLLPTG